jgi:tetratricopeptide (TPR) repeat protein
MMPERPSRWRTEARESEKYMQKNVRSKAYGAGFLLTTLLITGCALGPQAKEARFLERGKSYMAKKDYNRAAIEFQNAIRVNKTDAEPYYQLALTYIAMGDAQRSYRALNKAVQLNPKHRQAQIKMAELLALGDEKNVEDAKALANGVLAISPNNADALNAIAIAEWRLGKQRDAEIDFMRALSQAPENLQASLNLAKVKFYQKDVAGAEEVIKKAIAASPKSAAPVLGLGQLYLAAGKLEAAEQQFRRAIQLDPKNDISLLSLASLYVGTNRTDVAERVYRQLSALPDRKYRPLHAMFLFQSGKRDQAIAEFEKLAKDDPTDRSVRAQLVEAYLAVHRLADSEKLLSAALQKNSKDTDALLQRSRIYLTTGNYTEVQRDVTQVLRLQPDSATAHYVLAKVHQRRGETLLQRQQLSDALRFNKYLLPARLELAQLLLSTNTASEALQVLGETPESQKNQLAVLVELNWTLWRLGDMPRMRKGIDEALQLARTPDVLIQDGLWKLKSGKAAEARASLEEALKINPGDLRALEALSRSYPHEKRGSVALEKVKEYAARQPKSAPVQHFLGDLLYANGQQKEARAAFEQASTNDPKYVPARMAMAQLDTSDKKWDEVERRLKEVLSLNSSNLTAQQWLGDVQVLKGNNQEALNYYRQVVEAEGTNATALNNVAYLMTEQGKADDALKYAEKAVELAPENPAYADTLGWLLYKKGVYSAAVKHLERAASHNDNVVWKYHLAMAYAKAGEPKQAHTALEAALNRDPNAPEARAAKAVLAGAK